MGTVMSSNFAGLPKLFAKARVWRCFNRLSVLTACCAVTIASAAAAGPLEVALVEELTSTPSSVAFMDYLQTGQVIRLGPRDTLVLTYLTSCIRETITGGTVTIGSDRSEVQSGQVVRMKGQCGTGKMVLTSAQTPIGGRTFRGPSH
jgi:hypothetical protein